MEHTYLNCSNAQTQQCPHVANPIMRRFIGVGGAPVDYMTAADIEAADNLCRDCASFTLKE